jgi:Family of unknown function (DUF5706)
MSTADAQFERMTETGVRRSEPAGGGAELGRRLIGETLEELGYEDAKIARVFAATAVTSSAVTAGFFAGDWSPDSLDVAYRIIWFAGVGCALAALGFIAAAAVTRAGQRGAGPPERLAFYGQAAKFESERALARALREAHPDDVDRIGERLWHVSRLLSRKKRLLRVGLGLAALAVALCFIPVLGAALS